VTRLIEAPEGYTHPGRGWAGIAAALQRSADEKRATDPAAAEALDRRAANIRRIADGYADVELRHVPASLPFEDVAIVCLVFFFLSLGSVATLVSALNPGV
jgi:hypothetical protein